MLRKQLFISFLIACYSVFSGNLALADDEADTTQLSSFKTVVEVPDQAIKLPSLIRIPLSESEFKPNTQGVFEVSTSRFQPFFTTKTSQITTYTVRSDRNYSDEGALVDHNPQTFVEYHPEESGVSTITFTVRHDLPVTTSGLYITLRPNVESPQSITLKAQDGDQTRMIVNNRPLNDEWTHFPETTAQEWEIILTFTQKLQISDIGFEDIIEKRRGATFALTFLARPNQHYQLYLEGDRPVPNIHELAVAPGAFPRPIELNQLPRTTNPAYRPEDSDQDGIANREDNCPLLANSDQADENNNQIGDPCDDYDFDRVINVNDNCRDHPNPNQQDTDSDGKGDHCDDEESRLVEHWAWLPWVGILLGFGVVFLLLITTSKKQKALKK